MTTEIRDVHASAVSIMLAKNAEQEARIAEQALLIARIAATLDWFAKQPHSMSSIQVLLDLGEELNRRPK